MWTFGKKIGLGFVMTFFLMLAIGGMSYRSIDSLTGTSYAVTQTHELLFQLGEKVRLVSDLESQQRGFLLTGDKAYLGQIEATLAALPAPEARLTAMVRGDADLERALAALLRQADAKVSIAKQSVDIYRADGSQAAIRFVADGKDKLAMDELIRQADAMDAGIRKTLATRADEVEAASGVARGTIIFGTLLGLIVVVAVGVLLTRQLSTQVAAAVQHVQRSSTGLQAAATQQTAGARETSTSMTQIAATMSELLATSRQIADGAQSVAGVATETAAAARLGDGTVQLAQTTITSIRQQMDLVVEHMLELGRTSQQIGSVLDIVSELAAQTNILAINATIEASSAGDSGTRFAVVADEIRKLADRVAGATGDIRVLIDNVRSAVNTTVMATDRGSKSVDLGASQFGDVAAAFGRIAGLVESTTDAARVIEHSTTQQTSAVEQVNVAIAATAQATRESETSSGQTFNTARELASVSLELLRMVQTDQRSNELVGVGTGGRGPRPVDE